MSKAHLVRGLESPTGRPESPGPAGRNEDFATGYSLGLIGGVRAWVCHLHFSYDDLYLIGFNQMSRTRTPYLSGPTSPVASDDDRDAPSYLESSDERRRPSLLRGDTL